MKRRDVLKTIREAARAAGLEYIETELTNHTGVTVNGVRTVVGRHSEIEQAERIFKQLESALGERWWRS